MASYKRRSFFLNGIGRLTTRAPNNCFNSYLLTLYRIFMHSFSLCTALWWNRSHLFNSKDPGIPLHSIAIVLLSWLNKIERNCECAKGQMSLLCCNVLLSLLSACWRHHLRLQRRRDQALVSKKRLGAMGNASGILGKLYTQTLCNLTDFFPNSMYFWDEKTWKGHFISDWFNSIH